MCLLRITNLRIPNSSGLNNILILSVPLRFYFNAYFKIKKFFSYAHILLRDQVNEKQRRRIVQFIDVELVKNILITLYL